MPGLRRPRLIGLRKARELMLSGDVIDGREAKARHLVNDAAPLDELDGLIERFASRFSDKSPTVAWLLRRRRLHHGPGDQRQRRTPNAVRVGIATAHATAYLT
jgi:enoyl-CoA hydratase/carnithine racemase